MKRLFYILMSVVTILVSCSDDDSFSTSRSNLLSLGCDTLSLDTIFSTIPTRTYGFWIHNNSSDGIRIGQTRLERGNQTGFRVNVDGIYLDNSTGSQAQDIEVRKGDSIRVFVELTSQINGSESPQLVEDNLLFLLESGVEQKVNLRAWSWDAVLYDSLWVRENMTLSSSKPVVVRKGIRVDSAATLTILPPTVMYFSSTAGIDVYGHLNIAGQPGQDVVLRGDRLDWMFANLPYDRVSGQWRGIRFHSSSTGNSLKYLDLHSATDAIICDSAEVGDTPRLSLESVSIHNCSGYGLAAHHSNVAITNTLISNTMGDCLLLDNSRADITYSTFAQFYPFDANRGWAVQLVNSQASFANSLITGYNEDVFLTDSLDFLFDHCIVRTVIEDTVIVAEKFPSSVLETPKDSVNGEMHFRLLDTDNFVYDFRLDSLSTAIGKAMPLEKVPVDRDGNSRSASTPSIGCFEATLQQESADDPQPKAARRRR
ncbi:MAG: right-handed parallel beta-helix repeat-containing protein [Prevotella sp.]|nr:right-handed parallel beta-helix repeat-containing protein [Prevotella sp.]